MRAEMLCVCHSLSVYECVVYDVPQQEYCTEQSRARSLGERKGARCVLLNRVDMRD